MGSSTRTRAIAAQVQARARPGDRAILLYPPGLAYIAALCGCFYAGVIAVPAYPPQSARAADVAAGLFAAAAALARGDQPPVSLYQGLTVRALAAAAQEQSAAPSAETEQVEIEAREAKAQRRKQFQQLQRSRKTPGDR